MPMIRCDDDRIDAYPELESSRISTVDVADFHGYRGIFEGEDEIGDVLRLWRRLLLECLLQHSIFVLGVRLLP
jgi:hypothetical protein